MSRVWLQGKNRQEGEFMKKAFVAVLVMAGLVQLGAAQELGIRIGNKMVGDVAVDGVFSLGSIERIHADLGFEHSVLGIEALWDFLCEPVGSDNFAWYAGAGLAAYFGDDVGLGICGEIGIEYHFDGPVAAGVDWRPVFILVEETDLVADRIGINLRYVF